MQWNNSLGFAWRPISTAAHDSDLIIEVKTEARNDLAEGVEPLPSIECLCALHPDAGFCVDDLREVTHWRPAPKWAVEMWRQLQEAIRMISETAGLEYARQAELAKLRGLYENMVLMAGGYANELAELRERTTSKPIEEAHGNVLTWDSTEKYWVKNIVLPGEAMRFRSLGYTLFVPLPPPPEGETT